VFAGLLQVNAIAGAVERDLALFAAALRADAVMNSRAKALFFSGFAEAAGHLLNSPVAALLQLLP
jgi:hypothetical protein